MSRLYVDRSIEINASAQRVWDVLTVREHTVEWASEFSPGGPRLYIESDWSMGSPVLWKDKQGRMIVEGDVTAVEMHGLLRFTVFDARGPRPVVAPEDGITYKLTERDGRTVLWVSHGDFSTMADGATYRQLSEEIWERALARVKWLAEKADHLP